MSDPNRPKRAYRNSGVCTDIGEPETITEEGIIRRARAEGWAERLLTKVLKHHRVGRQGVIPEGTIRTVREYAKPITDPDPSVPRSYPLIVKAAEQLKALDFNDYERAKILISLPKLISIEPVTTKSANPVFSAITEDGRYLFVKKMPLKWGYNVEREILDVLSRLEEKGRYTKRFFPDVAPETFDYDNFLYLITELPIIPILDPSLVTLERMRVLGRLHGLSPAIDRELKRKGIVSLLQDGKDYGNPQRLMHGINRSIGRDYRFSQETVNQIVGLFNNAVSELEDATRDSSHRKIISPDTKDENWASTVHLDMEKIRWGARPESFSRLLFDKFAYDNANLEDNLDDVLRESLIEESNTVEFQSWMPRITSDFLDETYELTLNAGIIDMVRLLHYNLTTNKMDALENTKVYYANLMCLLDYFS